MNKIIFFLIILTFSNASADIIILKDGRILNCEKYWSEGSNIVYEYLGATVKIPKSDVKSFEKKPIPAWDNENKESFWDSTHDTLINGPKRFYYKNFHKYLKPILNFNKKMAKENNVYD